MFLFVIFLALWNWEPQLYANSDDFEVMGLKFKIFLKIVLNYFEFEQIDFLNEAKVVKKTTFL